MDSPMRSRRRGPRANSSERGLFRTLRQGVETPITLPATEGLITAWVERGKIRLRFVAELPLPISAEP